MAAPPSIDRQTFLAYLRQSGLVSEATLAEIDQRHADKPRGRTVARALIQEGVLTRFQAERLLMGRTGGFVLGQYRILDQLGRGGMGRVYRAEHRTMRRLVALKVLAADVLQTERAVQLFLHEVRAVAQLVHPNIVAAYDANESGGRYYLVLEFVDGPNLHQLVRDRGPLAVGLACDYVRQAALALQHAHQRGMLHRDVKPANILVQRHGAAGDGSPGLVKVSDFGLARLGTPPDGSTSDSVPGTILTKANSVMGTPDFLSPEQARSLHATDARSDLYSLGCTFYYLLTGKLPFPGGTALDKMIRHGTEKPTPIISFRTDVPPGVLAIVERLMAKRPDDRFQTAGELIEALGPYAVSGPTPSAPPKATPPSPQGSGRTPIGGDSEFPLDAVADEELTALARTMPASLDETQGPASRTHRRPERQENERLKVALIVAISVVAGLIALVGLAAIVLAGR